MWHAVCAGEVGGSDLKRLQHLCDGVIIMEAVREDSGIARLVSDAARCMTHLHSLAYSERQSPLQQQVADPSHHYSINREGRRKPMGAPHMGVTPKAM